MPLITSPSHPLDSQYSAMTGLIYVFNVIVGTGALAIPGVVSHSGYVLSAVVLLVLAFISYVTVTFVIEAMAISNAIIVTESASVGEGGGALLGEEDDSEEDPLLVPQHQPETHSHSINQEQILSRACFDISRTVEMGQMARMYFSRVGVFLFYLTLTVYLYGDLAIYITVVSKSLRDVVCSKSLNSSTPSTGTTACTDWYQELDREGAYRLFCILFVLTVGMFAFFNVTRTKYLQMLTTLFRWAAFSTMILLAIGKILGEPSLSPKMGNIKELPRLFGVSIYSFMCHHSLPSLVTPIKRKQSIDLLFGLDYVLIATFYILLSVTGVFAFQQVKDVYTLNFLEDGGVANYLLTLFPVFTLSTNFPIISITLKNNLRTLFNYESDFTNIVYTLLAILPPFLVSVFVSDVQFLVNFTGSFAGAGIQYVIPAFLVYKARQCVNSTSLNPYASPFKGDFWIFLVLLWTFLSICLVGVHMILA